LYAKFQPSSFQTEGGDRSDAQDEKQIFYHFELYARSLVEGMHFSKFKKLIVIPALL